MVIVVITEHVDGREAGPLWHWMYRQTVHEDVSDDRAPDAIVSPT